ncbi:SprT family zinc-dependent metalloprotease [Alicyclobacillus sp.]|uniref:M48 family metallopeptidase n=1 Tax=Alicyclobacillus sp. TaxID=61169 RepID=UPI0025BB8BEF|nr:SprT family zinc-dependent metalloprotease [Alicyclobacillus sp.]MCL6517600.1 M48 family metallopeptidase [Alicyclobacillus sp.]
MEFAWDANLPVHVVRSARRRRTVALEITPEGVLVRAPVGLAETDIRRILERRRAWIRRTYEARLRAETPFERTWRYLGEPIPIRLSAEDSPRDGAPNSERPHSSNRARDWRVQWADGVLHIHGPASTLSDGNESVLRHLLADWYRAMAAQHLPERTRRWAASLGLRVRAVRVKDQKSRWGSCSTAGNINLNWRLIQAPTWVVDYVIVHELCHLVEMNHSPQFWALVRRAYPDADRAKRWLKEFGHTLFF